MNSINNNITRLPFTTCLIAVMALMLFALVSIPDSTAYASNGLSGANIKDGKLIGYYGDGGDIVIPNTVTEISAEAFKGNDNVKSVTIPGSVNNIGYCAFEDCTALETVKFSEPANGADLTIRVNAFQNCTKLSEITIPECAVYVTGNVFKGCNSLAAINVDRNNKYYYSEDGVLFGPNVIEGEPQYSDTENYTLISYPAGKASGVYNMPSKVNGRTVNAIWASAFSKCKNLTGIEISPEVKRIGGNAFEKTGLKSINVPATVETDEYGNSGWFEGCEDLTDVVLAESITDIGMSFFEGCTSLQRVQMNGAASLGLYSFKDCTSLTNLILPDSLSTIGLSVFDGCSNLQRVFIPQSVRNFPSDSEVGAFDAFKGADDNLLVYVIKGSAGEKYAVTNAEDFGWKYSVLQDKSDLAGAQDGEFSLVDMGRKIKVTGAFFMGTTLDVTVLSEGDQYDAFAKASDGKEFKVYNISLYPKAAAAPNKMRLAAGVPGGIKNSGAKLYKLDNGSAADTGASISRSTLSADIDSLGSFAIIGDKDTSVVVDDPVEAESITLNKETAIVTAGKSIVLTSTVLPENAADKTVTWKSSDDSIATVNGGTVKGIAPGTVTITASTVNDKKASCTVTVIDPSTVHASKAFAKAPKKIDENGYLNFGVTLSNPSRIANVEITFDTDGEDVSVKALGDFTLIGTPVKSKEDGMYRAVLSYLGSDKLFSADGDNEIAKISIKGETPYVAVKNVRITGWKLDEVSIYGEIDEIDTSKVKFVPLSPYDFNEDGKVNEKDTRMAIDHYRTDKTDNAYQDVSIYDVNADGIIDVEDFVLIEAHIEE